MAPPHREPGHPINATPHGSVSPNPAPQHTSSLRPKIRSQRQPGRPYPVTTPINPPSIPPTRKEQKPSQPQEDQKQKPRCHRKKPNPGRNRRPRQRTPQSPEPTNPRTLAHHPNHSHPPHETTSQTRTSHGGTARMNTKARPPRIGAARAFAKSPHSTPGRAARHIPEATPASSTTGRIEPVTPFGHGRTRRTHRPKKKPPQRPPRTAASQPAGPDATHTSQNGTNASHWKAMKVLGSRTR